MVGFLFVFRVQGQDGIDGGAGKDYGVDVESGGTGSRIYLNTHDGGGFS